MFHYGSRPRVTTTTTTTTEDSATPSSERRVLRLTLLAGNDGKKEEKTADTAENHVKETWKKKNGLIHRERPAGMEAPQQHLRDTTNGAPATSAQHHGPKVYGVVQRTSTDRRQELMAREWSVDHLHDEMRYIREVRDSLEKVRERMYGQFGGMQQSVEKLSREIKAANAHRKTLESEVKVRTAAMENFDQMNTSLISANISLQKSLLENCQNRVDMKDEVKTLRSTNKKTEEKLRDKERELAAAQAENQTLRLQVESSREANTRAVQDLTAKLQREFEEKLQSEQQKHREEIENLQAQLDEYIRRLEEAERNLTTAEAKIAERDQRIVEVERLLSCMGMEKSQLQQKLQECEQRIRLLELTDQTDAAAAKKSKQLQEEAVDLRERIKHLNDMVFCQQRKVKAMIEEVESLRAQVAQKDMFISELLDRIAIVECENNELEDKLKYFMSTQNRPQEILERRDVGVGCDLLPRHEVQRHDVESVHLHSTPPSSPTPPVQPSSPVNPSSPTQPLSPTEPPSSPTTWAPSSSRPSYLSSLQYPSFRLTAPIQPRTYSSTNPPPSRLETSLLKYSPGQYSQYLQSSNTPMNGVSSESEPVESPVPPRRDEVDAELKADTAAQTKAQVTSSTSSSRPRSRLQVSSPFMQLIGHNLKDKH